jgi:hypothetical protein
MRYGDREGKELKVSKITSYVQISNEDAMALGMIPDTREPVKYSKWQKFKWFVGNNIAAMRLRIGSWIAGVELTDWEKY